ncbi:MAG: right-handed parallel beta-helix repeat-containing protein [Duncaniella sp.]|nr:right-handed parallel beta-helix repeat-containing protein [Duncaniella sp.]
MKTLLRIVFIFIVLSASVSCIEDGIDTSPSAQPEFSVDTLKLGVVFTGEPTPTSRFMVYNRHDKIISISNIALRGGDGAFRINVDGFSGTSFQNVEIRPKDSIFVFVEATLRPNGLPELTDFNDVIDFTTNGVTRSVVLNASGQDVERLHGLVIDSDSRFDATYPYQIYDSLVVAPGATLTIAEGAVLHFHDKAFMRVEGTLVTEGTPQRPVNMAGDRTGNVVGDISFDLMASQWKGLTFAPESRGNRLSHTIVRNTVAGVLADSLSQVSMLNCRLRNSAGYSLVSRYADISLTGCEVAEAAEGVMALMGGKAQISNCTFANYYLFSGLGGASVQLYHYDSESDNGSGMPLLEASFGNCIFYGNGTDLSPGDLSGSAVTIHRCLLKSKGKDDDNFIDCLWGEDPLYYTVRNDYYFDYRLQPESPAIGAGYTALIPEEGCLDFYGVDRGPNPNLGAYQAAKEE